MGTEQETKQTSGEDDDASQEDTASVSKSLKNSFQTFKIHKYDHKNVFAAAVFSCLGIHLSANLLY